MRRMKDKIEATVTNADYATSAGSATKATNADSATEAATADKLGTSAGTTTQPVYFKDGKPVVIGYTIAKSVPADAKFTDTNTTYSNMGGASTSSAGKSGLVPAPAAGAANRYLRSDGTWQVPPDTNTWRGIQNSLTSNSTTDSLSAAQGKELKTLVDGKADKNHSHDDRYYIKSDTDQNFHKRLGDIPGGDFDNAIVEGIYQYHSGNKNAHPGNDHGTLQVFNNHYNSAANDADYVYQIAYPVWGQHPWMRTRTDGSTWTDWVQVFTTDGGEMNDNIIFNKKSKGMLWTVDNGDIYHLRPYNPESLFQIVRQHSGETAYGAFEIYSDGRVVLNAQHAMAQIIAGDVSHTFLADGLHADLKGNADTALKLDGFDGQTGAQTWGVQIGTFVHGEDVDSGSFAFRKNCPASGQLSMVIDGKYYQNEGNYPCVDTSGADMTGYLNFGQTSTGLSWTCANGDIYHFRSYSQNSVFQLTRQNPSGVGEYGVFNVYGDGSVNITALGSLNFTVGGVTRSLLDWTYPIGSIYLSIDATSPAAKFGGTWTSIENLFLYPVPTNTAAGLQGGEASHTLTVAEMPSHVHKTYMAYGDHGDGPNIPIYYKSTNKCDGYAALPDTSAVGGNTAHNNMPPYMTMYAWYRVG